MLQHNSDNSYLFCAEKVLEGESFHLTKKSQMSNLNAWRSSIKSGEKLNKFTFQKFTLIVLYILNTDIHKGCYLTHLSEFNIVIQIPMIPNSAYYSFKSPKT